MRGDFIARVSLVRRGAQIGLNPRKSLALQTLRGSSRRRRRRLPEQRVIERILTEAVALHAFPAAAEHLERLLKPLIGKGLDQIIHGAQPHRVIDCFGIVCRRYHDHIRVHALRAELHQQLGAAHLRHVNVQDDQVDRIALKPEQSRMRRRKGLYDGKTAVLLHITAVQPRDHRIIFNNDYCIHCRSFLLRSVRGFPRRKT